MTVLQQQIFRLHESWIDVHCRSQCSCCPRKHPCRSTTIVAFKHIIESSCQMTIKRSTMIVCTFTRQSCLHSSHRRDKAVCTVVIVESSWRLRIPLPKGPFHECVHLVHEQHIGQIRCQPYFRPPNSKSHIAYPSNMNCLTINSDM
jgi:hypothetical protein